MKLLREIIKGSEVTGTRGTLEVPIDSVTFDSRTAGPGALFFAIRGTQSDGHTFIPQAIGKGVAAIVCEEYPEELPETVTAVRVANSSHVLGYAASRFFDEPSKKLRLIGITGTNGKTTIATLLYKLFAATGHKCGLLSTIENRICDNVIPATHTTPDAITLNVILAEMVDRGCQYCFMEVSSHAVDQNRVAGLNFTGGIFTNLTHDHLDYHKTFDAYLKAKKAFFDALPKDAFALVNKDDRNGIVMTQNTDARVSTYSLRSIADYHCKVIENHFRGLHLSVEGQDVWFRLTGYFNASNLLAVYATALLLGMEKEKALEVMSNLEPVNGRFNTIISSTDITAIVDYAHTPDALLNVLDTIQAIRSQKEQLITVVGAGGNRDAAKRPVMAAIACEKSDRVILTSDNPRFEDPSMILEEMKKGIDKADSVKVLVISDRREAIKTACALAKPGDIVLVAGKGHETYQEIRGVRHPFDDRKIIEEIFQNMKNSKTNL
jgi:UDP-N-acetylmuramoyl-L-alanyl-D-glutamate--2,6-diaminopimelate ligase